MLIRIEQDRVYWAGRGMSIDLEDGGWAFGVGRPGKVGRGRVGGPADGGHQSDKEE